MCGIVAAVGSEGNVIPAVLAGLKTLEYRGYDSAGMAVVVDHAIQVRRRTGKIAALEEILKNDALPASTMALAHTRWATHGAPEDRNAHPHRDHLQKVVVVHNGIIENYAELRNELQSDGCKFSSDTDTEVLANLIGSLLIPNDGDLHLAVRAALKQVDGAYALVAASADNAGQLVVARHDSPLVIGVADNATCAGSDMPALLEITREFIALENGETAILEADSQC